VGYRRGTLFAVPLCVVLLAGCSATVSHPSVLGSAGSVPSAAAPPSPVAATAPVSPSLRPAAPSSGSESPTISGTPTSGVDTSANPTSADVSASQVRATARAFIDDFNIALATGDVTKIEALTSPTCGCRSLVNTIKQMSARGERYDGVLFTLKSIDVSFLAAGASGAINYSISAGRVLNAAGAEVRASSPTPDGRADLFVISANGDWMVQQSILLGANDQ
jgi:hypothetical protein